MSCKNVSKKSTNNPSFDPNSITGVLKLILAAFTTAEQPATQLPPPLIFIGAKKMTGISAKGLASNIIARGSEANGAVGDVFADGPNVDEAKALIMAEEIVDMILTKAVVNLVVQPGVSVTTVGGNAAGPVVSQGYTTTLGVGQGIIS